MLPDMIYSRAYGSHIYALLYTAHGFRAEIDVYIRESGITYKTTGDTVSAALRQEIIDAFNKLY